MMKKVLAEGQVSVQLYTDYFGPTPYKRVAMTQQTACNFGQSWPALVWLPICAFFDTTVQHQLGIDWGTRRASWCAPDERGTLREGSIPAEQDGLSRLALTLGAGDVLGCIEMMSGAVWVRDQLATLRLGHSSR